MVGLIKDGIFYYKRKIIPIKNIDYITYEIDNRDLECDYRTTIDGTEYYWKWGHFSCDTMYYGDIPESTINKLRTIFEYKSPDCTMSSKFNIKLHVNGDKITIQEDRTFNMPFKDYEQTIEQKCAEVVSEYVQNLLNPTKEEEIFKKSLTVK